MKRLIFILMVGSLFAEENENNQWVTQYELEQLSNGIQVLHKKHHNPYGRPFTLNISYLNAMYMYPKLDCSLPITSWLTLKWGTYSYNDYNLDEYSGGQFDSKEKRVEYSGAEIHLPIYKMWEKVK